MASFAFVAVAALAAAVARGQYVVQYFADAACSGAMSRQFAVTASSAVCFSDDSVGGSDWAGRFKLACSGDNSQVTLNSRNYDENAGLIGNCDDGLIAFTATYETGKCLATDTTNDKLQTAAYQKWLCGPPAAALLADESTDTVYRRACTSNTCAICGDQPLSREPNACKTGVGYSKKFVCNYAEDKVRVQQWDDSESCEGDADRSFEYNVGNCDAVDSNEEDLTFPNNIWTCGSPTVGGSDGGSAGGSDGGSAGGSAGGSSGGSSTGGSSTGVPSVVAAMVAAAGAVLLVVA